MWRTLHITLAMMENLFKRKSSPSLKCLICNSQDESIEHLMLLCPWVETIWFTRVLNYKVDRNGVISWEAWLHSIASQKFGSKKEHGFLLSHMAFTCWNIWKARCNFWFSQKAINPTQVLLAISNYVGVFIEENHAPPTLLAVISSVEALAAHWSPLLLPS